MQFERILVEIFTEIIEGRGLKHDPTVNAAWKGHRKSPGRAWQAIRSAKTSQRLTISDAHSLANYLGVSMATICGMAEGREISDAAYRIVEPLPPKEQLAIPLASPEIQPPENGAAN